MPANIKMGTLTGDGAAQNVSIGFVPEAVILINATDRTGAWMWTDDMNDGEAMNLGSGAAVGSNGVTPYAGVDAGAGKGFTIGTTLSVSGKTLTYIAIRGTST